MFFNHRPKYVDLSPSSTVQCNCSQLHRRSQNVESLHAMMTHEMLTPHAVDSTAKNVDTTHYTVDVQNVDSRHCQLTNVNSVHR